MLSCKFLIIITFLCGIYNSSSAKESESSNNTYSKHTEYYDLVGTPPKSGNSKKEIVFESGSEPEKIYKSAHNEINKLINYVNFGILIAIFYMSTGFRVRNKCLVLFSCVFSIFSLFLNYIGTWMQIQYNNQLIQSNNPQNLNSDCIFMFMGIFTFLAASLFCILSYGYLFDISSDCENCAKKKSRDIE